MTVPVHTRACTSLNRLGESCKAPALIGKNDCAAHDPDSPFGTHENAVAADRLGGRPAADRIAWRVREQVRGEVAAILDAAGIVGVYGERGDKTRPGAYARRRGHKLRDAR
jgi:hypothetical protein